ncbi:carbohydrate kinase family protein [Phaeacidiphilus oryzae]|uniref:carbohydrate kinase family protein n=1 Tax=Phaeacidiphilus oryzae TaxID=348818 RepID=UPI000691C818|nr:PfkB family carbohydrate kinase [Phaeacidiphilus oryzae]
MSASEGPSATPPPAPAATRPRVDLLFAGELYYDLVFAGLPGLPAPGREVFAESFAAVPGGTATRCVAAARLGAPTAVLASVGTDMFGERLHRDLGAEPRLDLRWLRRDPRRHTPITVAVTDRDDRSFISYHDGSPCGSECPDAPPLPDARLCHLGIADRLPNWAAAVRARGTRLVGGVGWDASGRWSAEVLERLAEIDAFCPNEGEAMRYTRTGSAEEAARALAARVPLVLVTRGERGVLAIDSAAGERAEVDGLRMPAVDPTGAGDVFIASFLYAALREEWSLTERLRFAVLCAGLSVCRLGGSSSAPTWQAIRAYLDSARPEGYGFLSGTAAADAVVPPAAPSALPSGKDHPC